MDTPVRPPDGLRGAGAELWSAVMGAYELAQYETLLLLQACRTADLLEELQDRVDRDGALLPWGDGVRPNPAATEARLQRVTLARLLAALQLPMEDEDRPGHRGMWGVYAMRPAS
jgi:hypothetical protein